MVHLIYLRSGPLVVTRKAYPDWRQIQDEYADYMTSLGPMSLEEAIEYLRDEHPDTLAGDLERLEALANGEAETVSLG
jgi:hypothetical protein